MLSHIPKAVIALLSLLFLPSCISGTPWQPEYDMKACLIEDNGFSFGRIFGKPTADAGTIACWKNTPRQEMVITQDPLHVQSDVHLKEYDTHYSVRNKVSVSGGNINLHNVTHQYSLYAFTDKDGKPQKFYYLHQGLTEIPIRGNDSHLKPFAELMEAAKIGNVWGLKSIVKGAEFSERDLIIAAIEAIKSDHDGKACWLIETYHLPLDKKVATWDEEKNFKASWIDPERKYIYGEPRAIVCKRDELSINEALIKFKAENTKERLLEAQK